MMYVIARWHRDTDAGLPVIWYDTVIDQAGIDNVKAHWKGFGVEWCEAVDKQSVTELEDYIKQRYDLKTFTLSTFPIPLRKR